MKTFQWALANKFLWQAAILSTLLLVPDAAHAGSPQVIYASPSAVPNGIVTISPNESFLLQQPNSPDEVVVTNLVDGSGKSLRIEGHKITRAWFLDDQRVVLTNHEDYSMRSIVWNFVTDTRVDIGDCSFAWNILASPDFFVVVFEHGLEVLDAKGHQVKVIDGHDPEFVPGTDILYFYVGTFLPTLTVEDLRQGGLGSAQVDHLITYFKDLYPCVSCERTRELIVATMTEETVLQVNIEAQFGLKFLPTIVRGGPAQASSVLFEENNGNTLLLNGGSRTASWLTSTATTLAAGIDDAGGFAVVSRDDREDILYRKYRPDFSLENSWRVTEGDYVKATLSAKGSFVFLTSVHVIGDERSRIRIVRAQDGTQAADFDFGTLPYGFAAVDQTFVTLVDNVVTVYRL